MNTDIAEGKWKQLKGKIRESWGDLTDDELDQVQGRKEKFVGLMQEKYGKGKDEAEREFDKIADYEV
jgi:uncharacterized protein YjbJ (UPF0337 family)